MVSNIEVEHEEQLNFHLEVNEDVSSEDENMLSDQNLPLEVKHYHAVLAAKGVIKREDVHMESK
jgi:hypothetical protein